MRIDFPTCFTIDCVFVLDVPRESCGILAVGRRRSFKAQNAISLSEVCIDYWLDLLCRRSDLSYLSELFDRR
jgi:hypothetical protein